MINCCFCNLGPGPSEQYLRQALRRGLSLGSGPDEKVASDFTSVPDPSERRLLCSLLNEFYAAVLGAAVLGSVVGDGFVRALTYGTHVERIAAQAFEGLHDGLSALL